LFPLTTKFKTESVERQRRILFQGVVQDEVDAFVALSEADKQQKFDKEDDIIFKELQRYRAPSFFLFFFSGSF